MKENPLTLVMRDPCHDVPIRSFTPKTAENPSTIYMWVTIRSPKDRSYAPRSVGQSGVPIMSYSRFSSFSEDYREKYDFFGGNLHPLSTQSGLPIRYRL